MTDSAPRPKRPKVIKQLKLKLSAIEQMRLPLQDGDTWDDWLDDPNGWEHDIWRS